MRSMATGKEMPLPSWREAAEAGWLQEWATSLMLMNVATRNVSRAVRLPEGGVPVEAGSGLSKSAASRRFKALTEERMAEPPSSDAKCARRATSSTGSTRNSMDPSTMPCRGLARWTTPKRRSAFFAIRRAALSLEHFK